MIITLCSAKGAPGVSTTAAALAVSWPREVALLELDSSGGSMVPWWATSLGISYEPGLVSLAASRDSIGSAHLRAHGQAITDTVRLIGAPPHPRQVATVTPSVLERLERADAMDLDVVVDAGRVEPRANAAALFARSDVVIVVLRPRLADISVTEDLMRVAEDTASTVGIACIGQRPYGPADVMAHLSAQFAALIADDIRGADSLTADPNGRAFRRSPLARSVVVLARALQAEPVPVADAEAAA